jgi:hypothetical protein
VPRLQIIAILLISALLPATADEGAWRGWLHDGSQISIDPRTNKATRRADGEVVPLWDGVHQLNNGAVIIVRDGVVVRDAAIIEAQQQQNRDKLNAACTQLVKKVCGVHHECNSAPACGPARQLFAMERDELSSSWSGSVMESSTLCLEAMGNENFFNPCTEKKAGTHSTSCERLVRRSCGEQNQCQSSDACNAAHQLLSMELQDRFKTPGMATASHQCRDVLMDNSTFFKACE